MEDRYDQRIIARRISCKSSNQLHSLEFRIFRILELTLTEQFDSSGSLEVI
jgi:hypothetical protein